MKILITGITGRIGTELAALLVKQGHQVKGLVWPRDPRIETLEPLGVALIHGSLTERQDVTRAVAGMEAIYHLGAAFQGGGPFTPQEYFDINVGGTFNMLEAAHQAGTVSHFIYASTDALYDKYIPGGMADPIIETMPAKPAGIYALTKYLGEDLCNGYWQMHRLPLTTLRFAMVFGPGEVLTYRQFYLSSMRQAKPELDQYWSGEERLVSLKDDQGRSYKKHVSDVRDIVSGCLAALGREAAFGETIQLAGPRPFTWDEAVSQLSAGLDIPVVEATIGGIPTFYEFDLTKARRLLGFEPRYDIERMIIDALSN